MTNRARHRMLAILISPICRNRYVSRRASIIQMQRVVKMRLALDSFSSLQLNTSRLQLVLKRQLAQQAFVRRWAASVIRNHAHCCLRNAHYACALRRAQAWVDRISFLCQRAQASRLTSGVKRRLVRQLYTRELVKVRHFAMSVWPRIRFLALRLAASRLHLHLKTATAQRHYYNNYARQNAVVTLQSFLRTSASRRSFLSARMTAIQVQRHLRLQLRMQEYRRQRAAVTLLRFLNSNLRRKCLSAARMAVLEIQRQLRKHAGMQKCHRISQHCAASVLQVCLRCRLRRIEYRNNRSSAHVVIAFCHGSVLRRRYFRLVLRARAIFCLRTVLEPELKKAGISWEEACGTVNSLTLDELNRGASNPSGLVRILVAEFNWNIVMCAGISTEAAFGKLRAVLEPEFNKTNISWDEAMRSANDLTLEGLQRGARNPIDLLQQIVNLVMEHRKNTAADKLTAAIKGRVARIRYNRIAEVLVTLQCALRFRLAKNRVMRLHSTRGAAALMVQCSTRVWLAKRLMTRRRSERILQASVKLQSVARGWFANRVVKRKRKDESNRRTCAVVVIQRAFRSCPRNRIKPVVLIDDEQEIETG